MWKKSATAMAPILANAMAPILDKHLLLGNKLGWSTPCIVTATDWVFQLQSTLKKPFFHHVYLSFLITSLWLNFPPWSHNQNIMYPNTVFSCINLIPRTQKYIMTWSSKARKVLSLKLGYGLQKARNMIICWII